MNHWYFYSEKNLFYSHSILFYRK